MIQIKNKKQESGFALLITIIVLGVVVSVTLAIVELSLQQLKLAVDSTDSEIAFHAANAGLECARYTRSKESSKFESGGDVTFSCFGESSKVKNQIPPGVNTNPNPLGGAGQVNRYKTDIDWGTGSSARCTVMDIVTVVATSTITIGGSGSNSLSKIFSGYETNTKTCNEGERCTIMAVAGYSSPCASISSAGTLKREILLEL